MKFLLIAYYFGNSTDVGAQRWNKNIKYIQKLGWEPVVFTVSQKNETKNLFEIITNKFIEPNTIYKSLFKKKVPSDILTHSKKSFLNKLLVFIRSNFFIPDSRVISIYSSKRILRKRLRKNDIDLIVSTGPPHSMHLIAKSMSEEFDIPWITDFRDPWTGIEYFEKLPLLWFARKAHQSLEKTILNSCNYVITVSNTWADHLKDIGAKKVKVIHNGFDQEDFIQEKNTPYHLFMAHFGTYPNTRNHINFWKALDKIYKNQKFKKKINVDFYGFVYENFKSHINQFSLKDKINLMGQITHDQATKKMSEYHFLFLSLSDTRMSKGRIPLKFYEYLASGRKIIAIGKNGSDVSKIMQELNCGYFIEYGKEEKLYDIIKKELLNLKSEKKSNPALKKFSKQVQAKEYVNLFNEVLIKKQS